MKQEWIEMDQKRSVKLKEIELKQKALDIKIFDMEHKGLKISDDIWEELSDLKSDWTNCFEEHCCCMCGKCYETCIEADMCSGRCNCHSRTYKTTEEWNTHVKDIIGQDYEGKLLFL